MNATCLSDADCAALYPLLATICVTDTQTCICTPWFGLQGVDCNGISTASLSTTIVAAVALAAVLATIVRFASAFHLAISQRRIKLDPAGLMYISATLANIALLVESSALLALTFSSRLVLLALMEVAWFVAIIFLAASSCMMAMSFVDMTRIVKRPRLRNFVRAVALCFLAAITIIAAVLLGLEKPYVWGDFCVVVLIFILMLNIMGPSILYMRSSRNMAKAAGRGYLGYRTLLRAFLNDLLFGHQAMQEALERNKVLTYNHIITKRTSFIGGLSAPGSSESVQMLRFHAPPGFDNIEDPAERFRNMLHRASSNIVQSNARKREAALVEFVGRALNMSFYVSVGLMCYIALTVVFVVEVGVEDTRTDIRVVGIILGVRVICFAFILWQVLWFLDKKYNRRRSDATRDSEDFRASLPHYSLASTPQSRRGSFEFMYRSARDSKDGSEGRRGSEDSELGTLSGLPFVEEINEDEFDRARSLSSMHKPDTPFSPGDESEESSATSTDFAMSHFEGTGYGAQLMREIMARRAKEATATLANSAV